MATVGTWTGAPVGTSPNAGQRHGGTMAALGISPEEAERRRQQTGVDPGGSGYVSGQVPPGQQGGTGVPGSVATGTGVGGGSNAPAPGSNRPPPDSHLGPQPGTQPASTVIGNWKAGGTPGTTIMRGGLTAGGAAPAGGTTTVRSGLSSAPVPGSVPSSGNTGTTPGYSPVPSQVQNAIGQVPIVGPAINDLTTTTAADLGPTIAMQNAAAGLGANLNQERYDYRPGEAPAQDRVQLDLEQANQTRQEQQAALNALQAAAAGTVPSAAEIQMREEAGRNTAAALGMARALGGRSAGGAARAGTLAASDILSRNAVAGAAQRAAEQAQARNAYIQALGGVRGQDIGTSESNANLAQQANANNLQAQTQQNELAEKHREDLLDAQLKALGYGTQAAGYTVGASAKNAETANQVKGNLLGAIGSKLGL